MRRFLNKLTLLYLASIVVKKFRRFPYDYTPVPTLGDFIYLYFN